MTQVPLAERLRPTSLEQFYGLQQLDPSFVAQVRSGAGRIPSVILWGPPGSGKTTLAKLIGQSYPCEYVELSAVLSGVKEVRQVVERAKQLDRPTLLFVDEIHRFNKGQQDAFLPHVEAGTIALVGATTENPSFYLTSALLSRLRVILLKPLTSSALEKVCLRGEQDLGIELCDESRALFQEASAGDGRRLLNLLEAFSLAALDKQEQRYTPDTVSTFLAQSGHVVYDRDGEEHYNIVSAFIKSLRGSDADAALYWGFRMIDAGEDPRFVIRRLVIFASEDIGNADPRALQLAVSTLHAYELVGLPEGRIPIAQCITYLATAPKSNRSYVALNRVLAALKGAPHVAVPLHLRNAPTALMQGLGYGEGYVYPHDQPYGYAANVEYLPESVPRRPFYEPSDRGNEKTISERLKWLREVSSNTRDQVLSGATHLKNR
jgi:putative ATPase